MDDHYTLLLIGLGLLARGEWSAGEFHARRWPDVDAVTRHVMTDEKARAFDLAVSCISDVVHPDHKTETWHRLVRLMKELCKTGHGDKQSDELATLLETVPTYISALAFLGDRRP